ncbi:ArnT family glycosyltransferase [Spirosoma soli]|uniref:ArnT family glycosyltransferase n=1 Tax=Spirosoma soli TaxID=1770529 RepID=A0ABW5MA77_9BACT
MHIGIVEEPIVTKRLAIHQKRKRTFSLASVFVCTLLFLTATAVNLFKAFHIDDAFHLEAAQWIQHHPLKPMSGYVNWYQHQEPLHHFNQPPLYFYLIALVGSLFGYSEVSLHLLQAFFTLCAIFFFHQLARLLLVRKAWLLTAFFVLSPAFLVNQNLMVDVPLVALMLAFCFVLLTPRIQSSAGRYLLAASVLSVCLMIKYSALPLVGVFITALVLRKHSKYVVFLLIPVTVLGLWSYANYLEYGSIHLLDRPKLPTSWHRLEDITGKLIICLGAVSPFTLALYSGLLATHKSLQTKLVVGSLLGLAGIAVGTLSQLISEAGARSVLYGLFLCNGALAIGLAAKRLPGCLRAWRAHDQQREQALILFSWLLCVGGFIVLFTPFVATRHILLLLPPLLLLSGRWLDRLSLTMATVTLGFSAGLGLLLSLSDWCYADFYRQTATQMSSYVSKERRVWSLGHWGWQWYAKQAGLLHYDAESSQLRPGDWVVCPVGIDHQVLSGAIKTRVVKQIIPNPTLQTFISTGQYASFYTATYEALPYRLTTLPIDTVMIYEVVDEGVARRK